MAEIEEAIKTLGGIASTADLQKWLKENKNHSGYIQHSLQRMCKNGILKRIQVKQLHKQGGSPIIYALNVIEVKT